MQPKPMAETSKPWLPSFRVDNIIFSKDEAEHAARRAAYQGLRESLLRGLAGRELQFGANGVTAINVK
jgi:hypothetical protein